MSTPKQIANKMKSKGLQKLVFYCEMCQKQCRDANGFKCHTMSESHLRQMRIFAENPVAVMEKFSKEFEEAYMECLSRIHGTKRVNANQVYQEMICNKTHIHMNATKWDSLTTFVKYLGKQGVALVDETEKGWFVQYIDRTYLKRKEELDKMKKKDLEEETRQQRLMQSRAEAVKAHLEATGKGGETGPSELQRGEDAEKIVISAAPSSASGAAGGGGAGSMGAPAPKRPRPNVFASGEDDDDDGAWKKKAKAPSASAASSSSSSASSATGSGKKSELEKLMEQDALRKQAEARKVEAAKKEKLAAATERTENWVAKGIIVKIINKKIAGGKYYKKKGRVERVIDSFIGEVKLLEGGDRLRIDQEELETVIPSLGGSVLILNGPGKGSLAELLELDVDNYAAKVKVEEGSLKGQVLKDVQYEDICKVDLDFLGR